MQILMFFGLGSILLGIVGVFVSMEYGMFIFDSILMFLAGVILLTLSSVIDKLDEIEYRLCEKNPLSHFPEEYKDKFSIPEDTEGEAYCILCKRVVPKTELFYNEPLDIYCHKDCL